MSLSISRSRGVDQLTELREVTEQIGNRLQALADVRPSMKEFQFALTGVKLVNLCLFETLCLPSSPLDLRKELSVLSVASASCYS
jgi:hypothetical protein